MVYHILLTLSLVASVSLAGPMVAEQGTLCLGPMNATVDQLMPLINDMCWNVTGGMHERLAHADPVLNAWAQAGSMDGAKATVIAIDGDAKWTTCYGSFKTILDDCAKDGMAAYGMRRYDNELYIIDEGVTNVAGLTGFGKRSVNHRRARH